MGLTAFSVKQLLEIEIKYTSLIDNESYKIVEVSKIQNAVSLQGLYIRSYLLDKNSDNLEKIYAQRDTDTFTADSFKDVVALAIQKDNEFKAKLRELYELKASKSTIDNFIKEQAATTKKPIFYNWLDERE